MNSLGNGIQPNVRNSSGQIAAVVGHAVEREMESGRVIVAGIDDSPEQERWVSVTGFGDAGGGTSPSWKPYCVMASPVARSQNNFFCPGNPAHEGVLPDAALRSLGRWTLSK